MMPNLISEHILEPEVLPQPVDLVGQDHDRVVRQFHDGVHIHIRLRLLECHAKRRAEVLRHAQGTADTAQHQPQSAIIDDVQQFVVRARRI